eukprot:6491506-Amphidinium_carterae.2
MKAQAARPWTMQESVVASVGAFQQAPCGSLNHVGRQPVDSVCDVDSLQLVRVVVLHCALSQLCNGAAACPCEASQPTWQAGREMTVNVEMCARQSTHCVACDVVLCGLTRDVPAVGEQELKRRLGEAEKVEDELATSLRARKHMQRVRT